MNKIRLSKIAAYCIAAVLSILLVLIALTGCKQVQYVEGETITRTITITEHDTTIVTAPDSASLRALFFCDSAYNVVLGQLDMRDGERIDMNWDYKDVEMYGQHYTGLFVDCKEDSLINEIAWRDSTILELKERNIIQYVRERNGYDRFTSGGFWVLLTAIMLAVALWAVKKFYLRK